MKNFKVPVQKGAIKCGEPTYRTEKWSQKHQEAVEQQKERRAGQTCTLHTPKQ